MKWHTALLLSIASGLLLAPAYPPLSLGFLAWIGLVPFIPVMLAKKPGRVFVLSFISGLVFFCLSLFWLGFHPDIPWVAAFVIIAVIALLYTVPFVLCSVLAQWSKRLALALFPFMVTGYEWLRSFDQLAFPWMIYGNSQAAYPGLIQFADIVSAYGVSFWLVTVNVIVFMLIVRRSVPRFIALALLFILPLVYSQYVIRTAPEPVSTVNVAMVQGNVTPDEKWADGLEEWNIHLYRAMTLETLDSNPDLVIWPETATPVYLADITSYRRSMQAFVDSISVPVVTGTPKIDFETGQTWNSAALFIPGRLLPDDYRKIHLVPFGEAIPLDNTFPVLRKIDLGEADWDEGSETTVFETPGLPIFNTVICFESIFPDLVRRFVARGSQMLVIITNDVWFGPVASPVQHAMIAVMRAIEFKRPVARCANTGISMFIDPYGRIISSRGVDERTTLSATLPIVDAMTFYGRFGNIFSIFCFVVSSVSLIIYFIRTRLKKAEPGTAFE